MQDDDPYVRKTAAVCVAKLHDINAQLVEDQGFLDLMKDLLSDSTPMVVANTVAALAEIGEVSSTGGHLCLSFFHKVSALGVLPCVLSYSHSSD